MRKIDLELIICLNIFFFWEREREFQPIASAPDDNQSVFGIGGGLNSRSLIQPSETLLVELIGTHMFKHMFKYIYNNKIANIIISTTMEWINTLI